MKIPTILKGDDSGPIVIVMDQAHDYTGATLVVAYSGVTRTFTGLTPGASVQLAFTHEETAGFELGCKPVLMRLIGPSGAVETVENAEMKIKVTDCLGEVNAGGSFMVRPGASTVPVTDIGDIPTTASVGALYAKVNEIVRVLAQRSLLSLAALLSAAAFATVQTAQLVDLDPSSVVVTNVTESSGSLISDGTNTIRADLTAKVQSGLTDRWEVDTSESEDRRGHEIEFYWGTDPGGGSRWVFLDTTTFWQETSYGSDNPDSTYEIADVPSWPGVVARRVPATIETKLMTTNDLASADLTPATNYTDRATGEVVRLVCALESSVSSLESSKRDKTDLAVYTNIVSFSEWTITPEDSEYTDVLYITPSAGLEEQWCFLTPNAGFIESYNSDPNATNIYVYGGGNVKATRQKLSSLTPADTLALTSELTTSVQRVERQLADKADSSELEPLSIGYQRLYSFQTSATNVNISVTNYPPTAEEAEGRTHFDPTAPDPDLDFSTVPASLRVDETRGGKRTVVDTRDWPFWFFTSKLPGILAAAREYAREAYTNALVSLAAWASRTATGAENPAGDSTLVVDVPNIWLMTDQTFEKHVAGSNSCWVIRSKNAAVSPGVATNGFLELTDAFGAPYIRFNKTEATFADPPADGISYDADAGEWLISYSTEAQPRGGANVALQGSADYPGKAILKEADDPLCPAVITWSGSARNWVMHARPKQIDGIDPGRMFFGAVVEIEGQDYIEYLKPVSFSHIVLPNGKKIAPDVPQSATVGSTVTWKVVL